MKNGVAIYGSFDNTGDPVMADRDPNQYETILSGDIGVLDDPTDNCYHVFYHLQGTDLDETAILDGFTITGGSASGPRQSPGIYGGGMYNYESSPTIINCIFRGNLAREEGGGMYNYKSSNPIVTNCTFIDNWAAFGGGMKNVDSSPTVANCTFTGNSTGSHQRGSDGGMNNENSSPTVTGCTFSGNSGSGMYNVLDSSPIVMNSTFSDNWAYQGGGMSNHNSSPTVTGCTFTGNSAALGGGLSNYYCNPTVTGCTFSGNSAGDWGGGMYNNDSSPAVTNCVFSSNSANYDGGGMCNFESSPTLANCAFSGNSANFDGGGIYNWHSIIYSLHSNLTVTDCTFAGNSAKYGGGMYNFRSSLTVTNCILWGNTAEYDGDQIALYGSTSYPSILTISYSALEGGLYGVSIDPYCSVIWGMGNIDNDPLFVDADGPDGIIGSEDDNLRLLLFSPCIDTGDNSVVDANIPDLDGNPRIINGIVDMGAYEALGSIEADVHIVPRVINRNNHLKRIIAIMRLPEGISKSDVADEAFVLYPDGSTDGIEAIWERVIGWRRRARVFAMFDKAELMELVSGIGPVELTVTGNLISGQYIQGSDTVRIIQSRGQPRRRRGPYR
jgi:parallel beta-helix repeat protein